MLGLLSQSLHHGKARHSSPKQRDVSVPGGRPAKAETRGAGHVPKAPEKRCVPGLSPPPSFLPNWRWGTKPEDRINKSTDAASSFHSLPLMNNRGQRLTPSRFLSSLCMRTHTETQMKTHRERSQCRNMETGVGSSSISCVINKFSHSSPMVKEQLLLVLHLTGDT